MAKAPEKELEDIETEAVEHLSDAGLPDVVEPSVEEVTEQEKPVPILRLVFVIAFPLIAAAVMAGGVFRGYMPRFWAAAAALLGLGLAWRITKVRRPILMNILMVAGLFAIGLVLVIPAGFGNLFDLGRLVKLAIVSGEVQRPPVDFEPGWRAILGWLMGGLGFAAGWVAIEIRRPALALLVPLPIVAITSISVPDAQQVPSGLAALVLFAIGLGLLSGTEMGDDEQRPSLAFELRRGVRALPMLGVITVGLYFLSRSGFLFPPPLYDPAQEAQLPRQVPIAEVKDRVLFRVESSISGPWRMGHLDVYDGKDWRLPPFAQSQLAEVPRSGVVDTELVPGIKATFEVSDLGGAVLPGLPNTVGIVAEGPKLAFDPRLGNIRLSQGTIQPGLRYTVVAAAIPTIEELAALNAEIPDKIDGIDAEQLLFVPKPPPAVEALLSEAPTTSKWERVDYVRQKLLDTVTSVGSGAPVSVTPEKVQDMLAGSKEGSPFEIVAGQAMLARWAGVPARIGYGFDRGEKIDDSYEVRPKNGSSYLEVYFPHYKWLPVIGTPRQARTSINNQPQQFDPNVAASDEVGVRLLVPVALDPRSLLYAQIRAILAVVVPFVLLLLAAYYSYPGAWKAIARSKRRSWAADQGFEARIALAYAEWRDTGTDFGYQYEADTPLMFLDRVVEDEEHTELAWLVTRTLWGDLRNSVTLEDVGAAEELSKSLRKRLSLGHSWTFRFIAVLSRLSMRHPYAPALGVRAREIEDEPKAA